MKIRLRIVVTLAVLASLTVSCAEMSRYQGQILADQVKKTDYYWCDQRAEAYLSDSALVVYPIGFTAENDTIRTAGYKVFPASPDTFRICLLPLEQVQFIRISDRSLTRSPAEMKGIEGDLRLAAFLGMFLAVVFIYNSSI